jgi:adenosylhomocysteine nucleosidase
MMTQSAEVHVSLPICSLLLFVATPTEEKAIKEAAEKLNLRFRKESALTRYLQSCGLMDDAWIIDGTGNEEVVTIGCSRDSGRVVMGPHGRLGSAAKGVRYLSATGANGIIQVGMAFGIGRKWQELGDVLVSTSLVPYDNRDVEPSSDAPGYVNDYTSTKVEPARLALFERCMREKERTRFDFNVHIGAMLSGAARIHCARYRDELCDTVPHGNDQIIGGEMEGVGLLAASIKSGDPSWCVVKGIGDFADERRNEDIKEGIKVAPQNAAYFVLSAIKNDAEMLSKRGTIMNELEQMLNPPAEAALSPPLRYWKERIKAGDKLLMEVDRSDGMTGLARTKLAVLRWENGKEQPPMQFDWDDELNTGLIGLGVRARDFQEEGARFAFGLRAALRKVERRYGDGYLNAVLVDLLDESGLCNDSELANIRNFVHINSPERSRSYQDCRDLIASEIGGRAIELRDKLRYTPDEIRLVMTKALAIYLDERFSVSSRRQFGLL